MKICPQDGSRLAMTRVEGFVLDKCHTCDGIWCDNDELEAMKKAQLAQVEESLEAKYGDPLVRLNDKEGPMCCPSCDGRLIEQTYGSVRLMMRIDRCNNCFGIWLDKGELDAALGPAKKQEEDEPGALRMALAAVSQWLA